MSRIPPPVRRYLSGFGATDPPGGACARHAALSSRLEFYPDALPAPRAVKLAASSLIGLRQFDLETIKRRIFARYPKASPLPSPTELERLLRDAGRWMRSWDSSRHAFMVQFPAGMISGTSQSARFATGHRQRLATAPEVQAALQIDERIQRALTGGKLLALSVDPKQHCAPSANWPSASA
ncbi:MAG: hypothetical protein MZV65_36810 [Chromatiales bacterium]|nr:hypothetical protein [Chromatiales bacterium]